MKKGDFVIIGFTTIIFALTIILLIPFSKQGSRVVIKQNNKIIYNQSIRINKIFNTGTNCVIIKDGIVYMDNANCKNQVCVNTGEISKKGEIFHGHEFHYSKVIVNDLTNPLAFKITRGKGSYNLQDGFMEKNTLASYVHTHVAAMPDFAGNLCISARELGD